MANLFYITTTLPYVNDKPHIGHALEFIIADVIARYKREQIGEQNVLFNVGTDEHGQKIYNKAIDLGIPVQDYVDEYANKWKEFCTLFNISYTKFYRTTDAEHIRLAQEFWRDCFKKGDIYKKKYKGLYCVGCESFKTEKDLVDGKCPYHNREPIEFEEENYFFKLSKYTKQLLNFLSNNRNFVKPKKLGVALKNFIKEGLTDISVSRLKKNMPWGIDIPNDPEQVMYVWFDALTNYIFAAGYKTDNKRFQDFWPTVVQICGPDNLRFQGAVWQGMLASAELPQTKKLLVHGMVLAEDGRKMSKSMGNVVDPQELAAKYSVETVKYFFAVECPTYKDFAFSEERLVSCYNDNLVDKYGNLLNRAIHLINLYKVDVLSIKKLDKEMLDDSKAEFNLIDTKFNKFETSMNKFNLFKAYKYIKDLATWGNQYITENAPWDSSKTDAERSRVLKVIYYLLLKLTKAYKPVIPESAARAEIMLNKLEKGILFKKYSV